MTSTRAAQIALIVSASLALGCAADHGNHAIHASGHVEATDIRLASTIGGKLILAPFQEGARVAAGEIVARIDTAGFEHDLARARAELDAADARLRLLLSGTRAEDLRRIEQQLGQAQAELDAARRDEKRLAPLAEHGTVTEKAHDDAVTRREVAERALAALAAERDKLFAGPRREEIEAARAQRAAAQAAVAAIDQRIADATVTAPIGGVITERIAEPGEVLAPGAPVAVLSDVAHPWLNVYVDEPSLPSVRLGDPVDVRADGSDTVYRGLVTFVSPVAEFTPKNVQTPEERAKLVFRVKVSIDDQTGVFKPGMPADATFAAGARAAHPVGAAS